MRRERELKLLRKKRLLKRYSDFELSLLASEMNDYTYLLKSIKFPKEEIKIEQKNEDKNLEKNDDNQELLPKNIIDDSYKYKKLYSFGDVGNNFKDKKEKNESEEEYEGLKPKDNIKTKKKKIK